jgi:hypothetical protein
MNGLTANLNEGEAQNEMNSDYAVATGSGMGATVAVATEQSFDLQGYCYGERGALQSQLGAAFTDCGGWLLERRPTSLTRLEYRFEIQLAGILDLYGAMVAMGLELTRGTHTLLTDLCTCRQHITRSVDPCQILTLRLEVNFLTDVTLHSILMTGSSLA